MCTVCKCTTPYYGVLTVLLRMYLVCTTWWKLIAHLSRGISSASTAGIYRLHRRSLPTPLVSQGPARIPILAFLDPSSQSPFRESIFNCTVLPCNSFALIPEEIGSWLVARGSWLVLITHSTCRCIASAMTDSVTTLEYKGRVAVLTIANEKKLNALTQQQYYDIAQKLREIATHDEVYITVLLATGRFFSAYGTRLVLSSPTSRDSLIF